MEENKIIKLWKELGVDYANFEFSCGGDSMNDTSIQIYDDKGSEIDCVEIKDYIDDVIYHKVEFYEASDGHYQGEAGNVDIRLVEDDEEPYFSYSKSSQSEWSESYTDSLSIELSDKEIQFIKTKVLNINGGEGESTTNYKQDCILSDEEEQMVEEIEEKINDVCVKYQPDTDNDVSEWYRFTTNEQGDEIRFENNKLVFEISYTVTEYRDE